MNLTRYRTASPQETEITFPLLECWNPMTRTATIAAEVNRRRVLCRIPLGVLEQQFDALPAEPMRAVQENRSAIQAAARRLIEEEAFQEDGSILIQRGDL